MRLHDDIEVFEQLTLLASEDTEIEPGIIEKDYYVTEFLRILVGKQPNIIFKGGTSLSKCYKCIRRFSEDIDLNLESDGRPTEGERKKLKDSIVSTINDFGFVLSNPGEIRSRRDYNKYIVDFPSVFAFENMKQYLIVETAVFIRSFPAMKMDVSSLLYEYLKKIARPDIVKKYSLEPFKLNVQDIRRTFIDKLFAIGDYYLDGKIIEHSRHIYDIYKLFATVVVDDSLKELFHIVKTERSNHATCISSQGNVDLKGLLQEIIDRKVYKDDYEAITASLLYEDISYDMAVDALQKIVNSRMFD